MPYSRLGLPSLYLVVVLLALTGLFAKLIPLDAISMIQLRGVIAAVGLALFSLSRKRSLKLTGLRQYVGVYALGLVLGVHWVTFFHAMQISSVAVGMLALFSYPLITILLEPLFTKQSIKTTDIIAGVIMFAGLLIMIGPNLGDLQGPVSMGVIWGVFSALLFALRNLIQKYHFNDVTSDSLIFHQVVAVSLLLVLFVDYPKVQMLDGGDLFKLVLLGVLSTATAHTLLTFSLKQMPAKTAALISCLQPLIAAILAWYFIAELPEPTVLLGGGVVLSVSAYESVQKYRLR
jgi:drug/metabolite transporter (DMT)-like permease